MKCAYCKRTVPDDDYLYMGLCGMCGLYSQNLLLGIRRTKFVGEIAEAMRVAAVKHYKKTKQEFTYRY